MKFASLTFRQTNLALSALLIASLACTASAWAGCTDTAATAGAPVRFTPAAFQDARFLHANYNPGEDEAFGNEVIVGLWRFEARLKGAQNGLPDGFLLDWGLATWHDDGTEIQFSAARPPAAGDVCMGVWQQIGRSKFKLNHVALGLTPPSPSGTYVGPVGIRETVSVDPSGKRYVGTFTLTQYAAPSSGEPFSEFDESQPVATFTGTVTATRVTADN